MDKIDTIIQKDSSLLLEYLYQQTDKDRDNEIII